MCCSLKGIDSNDNYPRIHNLDNWPDLVEGLIQSFLQQGLDASDELHLLLEINVFTY